MHQNTAWRRMLKNYGNIDPVWIWVGFYIFSHCNAFVYVQVWILIYEHIVLQALTIRCNNKCKHHFQTCMTWKSIELKKASMIKVLHLTIFQVILHKLTLPPPQLSNLICFAQSHTWYCTSHMDTTHRTAAVVSFWRVCLWYVACSHTWTHTHKDVFGTMF